MKYIIKSFMFICAFFDWIAPPYPQPNPFPWKDGKWVSKIDLAEGRLDE